LQGTETINLTPTTPQQEGTQFILFFILCIVLMLADHYSSALTSVRSLLITAIEPIEKLASLPADSYHYFQQDFANIESLKKDNQDLKTELFLMKAKQQQLARLELEVQRLNKLLGKASQLTYSNVQIANISYYKTSPYSQSFTLNKGELDNVKVKQTVIDAYGLIGIITHTTPTSSKVQLITDAEIQIPVRIQRTGQRGILKGVDENTLSLQFISNTSSVIVGDLIETSGLAKTYPKGQPVATITQFKTLKDRPYFNIEAKPIAKLMAAEKVLILSIPVQKNGKDSLK